MASPYCNPICSSSVLLKLALCHSPVPSSQWLPTGSGTQTTVLTGRLDLATLACNKHNYLAYITPIYKKKNTKKQKNKNPPLSIFLCLECARLSAPLHLTHVIINSLSKYTPPNLLSSQILLILKVSAQTYYLSTRSSPLN